MIDGGTFTTIVGLEDVARAIAECAFVASELPVVLSLEVTLRLEHKIAPCFRHHQLLVSCFQHTPSCTLLLLESWL
jgi:hypothetical protein